MDSPSYKDKLQSLGFVGRKTKSKTTVVYGETLDRPVGTITEHSSKFGTGVSDRQDATASGGKVKVNPYIIDKLRLPDGK